MEQCEYPAGAVVFMPGDPSNKAYLIHSGAVELRRGSVSANDRETRLGPGEVFGELTEALHTVSARAIKPTRLSVLTRDDFEQALTSVPTEVNAYIHSLLDRLKTLSSRDQYLTPEVKTADKVAVTLHPLTRIAAAALPHNELRISKFPFKIGRSTTQPESRPIDTNDLSLSDRVPYNVSRSHALIDFQDGNVILKDRGSSLGIIVNDSIIGGDSYEEQKILETGDNIVVLGGTTSPFQFRISVRDV